MKLQENNSLVPINQKDNLQLFNKAIQYAIIDLCDLRTRVKFGKQVIDSLGEDKKDLKIKYEKDLQDLRNLLNKETKIVLEVLEEYFKKEREHKAPVNFLFRKAYRSLNTHENTKTY